MTGSLLTDAFAHHAWATLQVLDACEPLTDEQLATTVPGTYGSILDTLQHLVGSDAYYLHVLTEGRFAEVEEGDVDVAGMRRDIEANGAAWAALLGQDLDPDRIVVRRRDDGSEGHGPIALRLAQAIHHGTDHRSQICTALTTLGIEPPAIDVWDWGLATGRFVEVPPNEAAAQA
jgi:uncharacterized damage-inducible protein DinB